MKTKKRFDRVAIVGLGLLGAGVARQIRRAGLARTLIGVNRSAASRRFCKRKKWVDITASRLDQKTMHADLIILALPVRALIAWLQTWGPKIPATTLVMDVGSTKADIVKIADRCGLKNQFVGCHPMAGLEHSGPQFADQYEFADRLCFVTPGAKTPKNLIQTAQHFWRTIGMRVHVTTPAEHDAIVAHTSHLPQLVATALSATMLRNRVGAHWFGAGFKSTTRLASSPHKMWTDIYATNTASVLKALRRLQHTFAIAERALQKGDEKSLEKLLKDGSRFRKGLHP